MATSTTGSGHTAETKDVKAEAKVVTAEEQAQIEADMQKRHDEALEADLAEARATAEPPSEEEEQAAREKATEESQKR